VSPGADLGRQRYQHEQDPKGGGPGQHRGSDHRRIAMEADQADDRKSEERIDASAQSVGL